MLSALKPNFLKTRASECTKFDALMARDRWTIESSILCFKGCSFSSEELLRESIKEPKFLSGVSNFLTRSFFLITPDFGVVKCRCSLKVVLNPFLLREGAALHGIVEISI